MATCTSLDLSPKTKPAPRCSGCSKHFKAKLEPRNCSMCGDIFCQQCTIYRRKLSNISAIPDDVFGTLYNVCGKCFKAESIIGCYRDLNDEFRQYRSEKIEADIVKAKGNLCCSPYTSSKRTALFKELDRLKEGFSTNAGFFRSLIAVPGWQRSINWVESQDANQCYQCKKMFAFLNLKSHCRIGGQVFCGQCIKEDLIIYLEDKEGEPKWCINSTETYNSQMRYVRFEIYKVCSSCSADLQTMFAEYRDTSSHVYAVHQSISRMQTNLNRWLPEYQQEVEAVNLGMRSIEDAEIKLARLHLNLSNTISAIEKNETRLYEMHQQLKSPVDSQQQKLVRNILKGSDSSRREHDQQFYCTNEQLPNQLSREKLSIVQQKRSWKSMICVYSNVSKLVADLNEYTKHYDLESTHLEDVKKIEVAISEELKSWPESLSWDELLRAMKEKSSDCGIHISQMVTTSANLDHVKFVVISQSLTILQQCSSNLKDETLDLEFQEVKWCLKQAWDRLEMTLIQFNRSACVAFQ